MLRFREKNGKNREIPVRHDLEAWLREYLAAAGIAQEMKTAAPLFRAAAGKKKFLTEAPYAAHSMRQMLNAACGPPGYRSCSRRIPSV